MSHNTIQSVKTNKAPHPLSKSVPSNQQDTEELHQTSKAIMPLKKFN